MPSTFEPNPTFSYLKEGRQCADLGTDFFDRLEPQRLTRYYVRRLERLGYSVKVEPCVSA